MFGRLSKILSDRERFSMLSRRISISTIMNTYRKLTIDIAHSQLRYDAMLPYIGTSPSEATNHTDWNWPRDIILTNFRHCRTEPEVAMMQSEARGKSFVKMVITKWSNHTTLSKPIYMGVCDQINTLKTYCLYSYILSNTLLTLNNFINA